jgi:hypothetical protein
MRRQEVNGEIPTDPAGVRLCADGHSVRHLESGAAMNKTGTNKTGVRKRTGSQILLEHHLDELGLEWVPEFRFYQTRKWRSDYKVWFDGGMSCLIEIEGGVYVQGRHSRGAGMEKDMVKYNEAQLLGYPVFRFSTRQILHGDAREFLRRWKERMSLLWRDE